MTEQQVDELVERSAAGEGVETIIKSFGLDAAVELEELKKHPSARDRLKAAKKTQRTDPVAMARIAATAAAAVMARVGL